MNYEIISDKENKKNKEEIDDLNSSIEENIFLPIQVEKYLNVNK